MSDNFRDTLETFENPQPNRDYLIEIECPEFTSVCPKTGQPDFGTIVYSYVADQKCVELKSLKLYLQQFRNEGIFYEAVTNRIRDDLAEAMAPTWMQVITNWKGRGGFRSRITAVHGEVPMEWRTV